MRLANKVALIPGSGSGFGEAIATTFAREGARVVLADIDESAAKKVAAAWPKGTEPPLSVEQRGAPDIDWIARLGAAAPEAHGAPKPLYLREPDARPQDGARLPRR